MSASPVARSEPIPINKLVINDPSELPEQYSSTPGGTVYSTTPGGTKIVYEKEFIMNLRNSPISKTLPSYEIPEALIKAKIVYPKLYWDHCKQRARGRPVPKEHMFLKL